MRESQNLLRSKVSVKDLTNHSLKIETILKEPSIINQEMDIVNHKSPRRQINLCKKGKSTERHRINVSRN